MTIGMDLGDRCSQLCELDDDGATLEEGPLTMTEAARRATVRVITAGADRH